MLTSITSEVTTSTGDQVTTPPPPPTALSTAMDLSLKAPETLEQADMYGLETSLDNNHLLQVGPINHSLFLWRSV